MLEDKKEQQKIDPVKAQTAPTQEEMGGLSPMGDAEDFQPDSEIQYPYEALHPFLKELFDEHVELTKKVDVLKAAVATMSTTHVLTPESNKQIQEFLEFFHEEFVPHNKKEEADFFPILHKRLLETQEHSTGSNPFTGIKILEDDHVHAVRLGAILANQIYLMSMIKEFKSQSVLANEIRKTANELAELIELHIFREDNIAIGLGQKLLTTEELDQIHANI